MATAIAERQPQHPLVVLRSQLEQRAAEFKMVLPSHITPEKFQRTILTAVQTNEKLLTADRRSLITACNKAAQDGLLPDGREAALVEFVTRQKDANGQWTSVRLVQYMPMVYGLRKKILQSGEVTDIFANVVYRQEYEAELFYYEEGTERALRHKPLLDPGFEPKDEDIIAAYSVATFPDGTKSYEVMRRFEINKVRQCSQTGALGKTDRNGNPIPPKGPWVEWFPEQAKKTVMRRHSKTLPMSSDIVDVEANELAAARSAVSLLASANEDAPLAIEHDDGGLDEVPHDPETGEIIDATAEEKTEAPPRRQRKPKAEKPKEEPEPEAKPEPAEKGRDTVTEENPATAEGPGDDQRGDGDSDAEARAAIADYIKAVKEAPNTQALDAVQKRGDLLAATIRRDFPDLYPEIDPFRPADAPERGEGGLFGGGK